MDCSLIGAIKVKDGLFIGDEFAAQDLEFVVTNKVTHIINCAQRQVPSHWEPIGVKYLKLNWLNDESQNLFESKDDLFDNIFDFMNAALSQGESVLVHSVTGQCRCCVIILAYFMKRFNWTLFKAIEFLNSRRPDIDLMPNFVQQLAALENRLIKVGKGPKSADWENMSEQDDHEEKLLHNTYINSRTGEFESYNNAALEDKQMALNWADGMSDDPN